MKAVSIFFFSIFFAIILSSISKVFFLPIDILNYLPAFSQETWTKPHNSLLADPVFQFEPWRNYAKERFLRGEFPLWNNLNGGGSPFFANPQTSVLYPLNLLYYFLPVNSALFAIFSLKLYLFGIFLFLYFRSIKCSIKASIITSIASTFAGFPIVWLLWPQTNVFILFPLILYITEKIYESKFLQHRWYALLVLVYFVAVLGGHPETLFHITLVHVFYTIVRFWGRFSQIMRIGFSIFLGFLLSSFQLLPFFEYLINSYALSDRLSSNSHFYLPIESFILNIFPFFLGAPHRELYRPIAGANFQEAIGGYTGPIVFCIAILGMFLLRKIKLIQIWVFIVLFSWLIAYGIWPLRLITDLSLVRNIANQRLIAFAGLGIFCIFAMTLSKIEKSGFKASNYHKKILNKFFTISFFGVLGIGVLLLTNTVDGSNSFARFSPFFVKHIVFIALSTILFFWILNNYFSKSFKFFWILVFLVLSQTVFIFWDYNTVSSSNKYYRRTKLIDKLTTLPKGRILEVGNPSVSQNLNLIYGLNHAENYDALEIYEYKNEFDKSFPIKNQWGKVNEVTQESLQKFGIQYLISDYDINLKKIKYQPEHTRISDPILSSGIIKIPFRLGNKVNLRQIRILTANFNRMNTCSLLIKIIDVSINKTMDEKILSCSDIRDFMYYTVPTNVHIDRNNDYRIEISSPNASEKNSVALWGDNLGKPYFEILYSKDSIDPYKLLTREKDTYLWEVPSVFDIKLDGQYSILERKPEKLSLALNAKKDTFIEIKQTFYHGWKAKVDYKEVKIENLHPFIGIRVPKGGHVLTLEYHPASFMLGLLLSFSTLVGLIYYWISKEQKVAIH